MPSVINGGDEFTDLIEAFSATENGGTQAPYDISKHRTIAKVEREKDGDLGACKKSLRATPSTTSEDAFLGQGMKAAIIIDIFSQSKN